MPKEKVKVIKFRSIWLNYKEYKPWLQRDNNDPTKFYCGWCQESVALAKMGISAVKSHSISKKHKPPGIDIRRCFGLAGGASTSTAASSTASCSTAFRSTAS